MPYSHHLHPLAQKDIIEAYEWYENKQQVLGDKFAAAFVKKIKTITNNPLAHSSKRKKRF